MRRVCIVTTSYPSGPGDPSGHFVQTEARRLAPDAEVTVVTARVGGESDRSETDGRLTVLRLPAGDAFGWPGVAARVRERPSRALHVAAWSRRARAVVARLGALDGVVAHWALPSAFPVASARARGVPLEIVSHGADVRLLRGLPAAVRAALVDRLATDASAWRFVSQALQDELARSLPSDCRRSLERMARVEASPIDVPDVRAEAAALRAREARDGGRLLVCAGRLVASKRFDRALAYAADRSTSGRPARVVVVGDGPERRPLEALASELGVDARFAGLLRREEALAWIGAADALLHASQAEGLSTVVREAEALGVAVVRVP